MNRLLFLAAVSVCLASGINAQVYNIQLNDKVDKIPIAYAVVGIPGTNIGTYSDENGNAALVIGKGHEDESLLVSLVGYEDYKVKVTEFISAFNSGNHNIYLNKATYELREAVVKPHKLVFAELGNEVDCDTSKDNGGLPMPYFFKRKKSEVIDTVTEIGTLMKVKHKKTYIDSVQINIGNCTYENIFYRLNIYEKQGDEFKNILKEPIYIKLKGNEVGKNIKVNLEDKNLAVQNNFIVSIERVKDLGPGELTVCGKMLGASMYARAASRQEKFVNIPIVGMSIAAFVTFSEDY